MKVKTLTSLILGIAISAAMPCLRAQTVPEQLIPGLEAELYDIDTDHSHLEFSITFMGISEVKGRFKDYEGAILYNDDDLSKLSFTLVIQASSIDTGLGMRDKDLRSERFFHTEKYPHIIFKSERIERNGEEAVAHGALTMRGVTKPLAVPFTRTLRRVEDSAWHNVRIACEGSLTLNRNDFGVGGSDFWGKILSEEVKIDFNILGRIFNVEAFSGGGKENAKIIAQILPVAANEGGETALAQFKDLTASRPFKTRDILTIGRKLVQRKHASAAIPFYLHALAVGPDHPLIHQKLGEAYALEGMKAEATKELRQTLGLNPANAVALELLRQFETQGTGQ